MTAPRPLADIVLAMDSALAFWSLLLPVGLSGASLSHRVLSPDGEEIPPPPGEQGWSEANTQLWLEYMQEKGGKGVSKDTWSMFLDFVRSVDDKLTRYDTEGTLLRSLSRMNLIP